MEMSMQNENRTKTQDKRTYTTPELQIFGHIAEMTDGTLAASGADANGMRRAG